MINLIESVPSRADETVDRWAAPSVVSLRAVRLEVATKRDADLLRFRTCCADPRASK